jgi:hypothetical protein
MNAVHHNGQTIEECAMSPKSGKPKTMSREERKDEERDMRHAVVEDADKTEGMDRDLVHGDGGTLGLGEGESLSRDD